MFELLVLLGLVGEGGEAFGRAIEGEKREAAGPGNWGEYASGGCKRVGGMNVKRIRQEEPEEKTRNGIYR